MVTVIPNAGCVEPFCLQLPQGLPYKGGLPLVHHTISPYFPLSLATSISADIHSCTPPSTKPTLPAHGIPMQSKCLWVAKMPLLGRVQPLPRARVPFPQPHTVGCNEHHAVCGVPAPSAGHGAVMRAGSGYWQGWGDLLGQSSEGCLPSPQRGALNQPVRWKEQKSPQNRENASPRAALQIGQGWLHCSQASPIQSPVMPSTGAMHCSAHR